MKFNEEVTGSIAKVVSEKEIKALKKELKLKNNDLVLILAGNKKMVKPTLGAIRVKVAADLDLAYVFHISTLLHNYLPMGQNNQLFQTCHRETSQWSQSLCF